MADAVLVLAQQRLCGGRTQTLWQKAASFFAPPHPLFHSQTPPPFLPPPFPPCRLTQALPLPLPLPAVPVAVQLHRGSALLLCAGGLLLAGLLLAGGLPALGGGLRLLPPHSLDLPHCRLRLCRPRLVSAPRPCLCPALLLGLGLTLLSLGLSGQYRCRTATVL